MHWPESEQKASGSPYRIVFIVCYFGARPWYVDFFLHSCAYNPSIDFFLFTDWKHCGTCPQNVVIHPSSLEQIRTLASTRLGFEVALTTSYKLCDIRPAFGVILSDYISGYDYWGYCDIDVVFGNILHFVASHMLDKIDIISSRKEYLTGFFALYKNTPTVNRLFMESADYRKVFQHFMHYCFDECNFGHEALVNGASVFQLKTEIQSMTYVVKKQALCGAIKAEFANMIVEDSFGSLEWNHGQLLYKQQPALLYHFIYFKEHTYIKVPSWKVLPGRFFIWSFFISQHGPDSIYGFATWVMYTSFKRLHNLSWQVAKYIDLLKKRCFSTRTIKNVEGLNINYILGTYKDENVIVDIQLIKGRLCACWDMDGCANKVFFHHQSHTLFMMPRFKNEVNVNVEFGYNPALSVHSICIKPFGKGKFYLYKTEV